MKKYLIALLFAALLVPIAYAEGLEEVELNAFGFPDKSFVKLIVGNQVKSRVPVREKPDCNDSTLINLVKENSKPYIKSESSTIYNNRRGILIIKNIGNFTDISIDEAQNIETNILKARLVELKINNHIGNENIKLCQSDNPILKNKLYLLMYDDNNNIKVELLNLTANETPSFYFYDK